MLAHAIAELTECQIKVSEHLSEFDIGFSVLDASDLNRTDQALQRSRICGRAGGAGGSSPQDKSNKKTSNHTHDTLFFSFDKGVPGKTQANYGSCDQPHRVVC